MKKFTDFFKYDALFLKYPGCQRAYTWYLNNKNKYKFFQKIILFKEYIYYDSLKNAHKEKWYFLGAYPDDEFEDSHIINLYILKIRVFSTGQDYAILNLEQCIEENNDLIGNFTDKLFLETENKFLTDDEISKIKYTRRDKGIK